MAFLFLESSPRVLTKVLFFLSLSFLTSYNSIFSTDHSISSLIILLVLNCFFLVFFFFKFWISFISPNIKKKLLFLCIHTLYNSPSLFILHSFFSLFLLVCFLTLSISFSLFHPLLINCSTLQACLSFSSLRLSLWLSKALICAWVVLLF